jgi:hypothetical protein
VREAARVPSALRVCGAAVRAAAAAAAAAAGVCRATRMRGRRWRRRALTPRSRPTRCPTWRSCSRMARPWWQSSFRRWTSVFLVRAALLRKLRLGGIFFPGAQPRRCRRGPHSRALPAVDSSHCTHTCTRAHRSDAEQRGGLRAVQGVPGGWPRRADARVRRGRRRVPRAAVSDKEKGTVSPARWARRARGARARMLAAALRSC